MAVHSNILAGKCHGQRSLGGYSPWGCRELDTTEHAHSLVRPVAFPLDNLFTNIFEDLP